jgi:hypothetical protein
LPRRADTVYAEMLDRDLFAPDTPFDYPSLISDLQRVGAFGPAKRPEQTGQSTPVPQ